MADPWAFEGESAVLESGAGLVTLVEGSAFCLSGRSGDIRPGTPHGVFVLDVRHLSCLRLSIDGEEVEPLSAYVREPFAATFVARARPGRGRADSSVLVLRERYVGQGMREDITVRNYSRAPVTVEVSLSADADFADLFAVKESRVRDHQGLLVDGEPGTLTFRSQGGVVRDTVVAFSEPAALDGPCARWAVTLGAGAQWQVCVQVTAAVDGVAVPPRYGCGEAVAHAVPARRLEQWRAEGPTVASDNAPLATAVAQAVEDLGALRIFDPAHPERAVVAAGAPWFMTLFGRDSLLASWMSLIVAPDLARGVLETLADLQGTKLDPETEEQPGRILHEVRFGASSTPALAGAHVYYGTADATPLFVMLLGELRRWGLDDAVVARLMPHADRAIEWIERYGDADGDGYVEYERMTPGGLLNQGWKDSWDGVPFADGTLAEPPIALAEVQGYTYAAYVARAFFAAEAGDAALAERLRAKAYALRVRFNEDFWLPDRGYYALALDRDKRPVDALASNMGHCLWTGIVDADKAPLVAERLLSPELFSGWGVRTLATSMASYNPISYHCGSVWPHDNAIAVAGLVRYGFVAEAHRIMLGMLDAAAAMGGRLPELFSGLPRDEVPVPVPYPTSCSPQAWASAAPLSFLRSLLRFDPWVPHGRAWLAPDLPAEIGSLTVDRVPLGAQRLRIRVAGASVEVDPVPTGIELVRTPRHPLSEDLEGRTPPG
ncbi:MAG TPA: glycogen debranching N-terminal domain-containing protein [Frankiaceae bacterium]|nr:glycogen debranching N-terminal domain-containing protein [Frankiaceae bacterium]